MKTMITTKTGDDGKSRWMGRVEDKDGDLLEAVGSLDELQAVMGMVRVKGEGKWKIVDPIEVIEKDLWGIMGILSCETRNEKLETRIKQMERDTEEIEKGLPKQTKFVVPGENEFEAWLNLARTVCRRVERRLVKYGKIDQKMDKNILIYINRLSDYLFILGRL